MRRVGWLLLGLALFAASAAARPLPLDGLRADEARQVEETVRALEPLVTTRRAEGTLPLITFPELYGPLSTAQRALCDAVRAVTPGQVQGSSRRLPPPAPDTRFVPLKGQTYRRDGQVRILDTQYLPQPVEQAYRRMMAAMQRDLGTHLLVESGYRSPAHQLYLFLFYLPTHGYSVRETNRFVALPGGSEHGCPARQALDFINAEGINGEDHPELFEALPEYAWLQQRAGKYGFHLSYPRNYSLNTSFEPWHWRYEPRDS